MTTETRTALPVRKGPRPKTGPALPHQQLSEIAPPELQEELWRRMSALEDVHVGRSHTSLHDTRALHLDPAAAKGPPEAFMVGTEFAHLHGRPDGSLHLVLPGWLSDEVIERSWGELHPAARMGQFSKSLVMLYGPRDEEELETIWGLVESSYDFARGEASPAVASS